MQTEATSPAARSPFPLTPLRLNHPRVTGTVPGWRPRTPDQPGEGEADEDRVPGDRYGDLGPRGELDAPPSAPGPAPARTTWKTSRTTWTTPPSPTSGGPSPAASSRERHAGSSRTACRSQAPGGASTAPKPSCGSAPSKAAAASTNTSPSTASRKTTQPPQPLPATPAPRCITSRTRIAPPSKESMGLGGAGFPRNLAGGAAAGGHGPALLATGVLPVRGRRRDRFQGGG